MTIFLRHLFGGTIRHEDDDDLRWWERLAEPTTEGERLRERFRVHEARTQVDLESGVVRHAAPGPRG